MKEYKSPYSALIWSLVLPGCGQLYNGQIFLGLIILVLELLINTQSNLNLSILETFHGDFTKAHKIINFEWGLFYPSLWGFSLWQAFNKARAINALIDGNNNKETKLTGFLAGTVIGMNIGIYIHFPFLDNNKYLFFMNSPVLVGLILGLLTGLVGKSIEKIVKKNLVPS